jgi:putative membrane protein
MMDGMMGSVGWPWILLTLLFWGGLLAFAAWALIKILPNRGASDGTSDQEDSVEEILRKRFARGEIGTEEYERSIEVLKGEKDVTRGGV